MNHVIIIDNGNHIAFVFFILADKLQVVFNYSIDIASSTTLVSVISEFGSLGFHSF